MDLQITSKEKNNLLKLQEIKFEIKGMETTPKRKDVLEKLSALTNSKEENMVVKSINHKFGSHLILGTARLYETKQDMQKIEPKYIMERNFGKTEKKQAQKPPEAEKK